jgi:zinc transporter ZupT
VFETVLFSGLAGLITLTGVVLVKLWHRYALRYSHLINSFAAGLILTAGMTVLFPRSVEKIGHQAGLYVVGGFAVFLILETLLVFHSGAEFHYGPRSRARGLVFFWGLFLHSLLDGVAIAVGFATSFELGILTSIAVISHELPEGITTFSLLLDKLSVRTALRMAIAVALATPVGGVVGTGLLQMLSADFMGIALALVSGSFLYIAATDIVPEIREEKAGRSIACMILGIAFLAIVHQFLH